MAAEDWWSDYVAESWARYDRGEIGTDLARLVRPHLDRAEAVLDVGAGPGHFLCAAHVAYPSASLAGLDASPEHVARAQTDLAERGVAAELRVASGAAIPFEDAHFDLVICQMVMPYAHDDHAFVAELVRVLRPGGVLWFATHGLGFYTVRIARLRPRDVVRYSASILSGALAMATGWKPVSDTPVTSGWVMRTLATLGLDVHAIERVREGPLTKFIVASATKRAAVAPATKPRVGAQLHVR